MKKYYSLFAVIIAVFFFWAAWQTHPARTRHEKKRGAPAAGAPPLVVLTTTALGGFRGLLVDLLWMRMIALQKTGRVFEIVQLADWITKLEPQFTTVWAFHAWNMAYNISILYPAPEYRWLWVKNGIGLLRDNALKYNPGNPVLCRELGWLYQHKIGQDWDDMHVYYKFKLALEMENLFRGPRPDYRQLDSEPEKTQCLRVKYKLLPEIMQSIERDYGQLDWRLADTHALYWAYRGLHEAAPGQDTGQCDQMLYQAMADEFRQGRVFMDPDAGIYLATPRLDLLPGALKAYEDAVKLRQNDAFRPAYLNFLAEAAFIFNAYGRNDDARKLFEKMLAEEPPLRARMTFENYILDCEQTDIAALPQADAGARIEGLLYQDHLRARGGKAGAARLREKAKELWSQYAAALQSRGKKDEIPPFEMFDRQALERALQKSNPGFSSLTLHDNCPTIK